ncbi:MAG TPA: cytochrome c, partial [Phnomibacter sp.]|nr:cytochrome c [Phnomibacter sp.]
FTGWFFVVAFTLAACGGGNNQIPETRREVAGNADTQAHGKKLFYSKCASCHMVNKELSGPALRGVRSRWPNEQKLYAFIRNSEAVINTDAYARQLWLNYNQTAMTKHEDLTDADIAAILQYIEAVSTP